MASLNSSQSSATLIVKPICASLSDSQSLNGKMRLFCKVQFGEATLSTIPDRKNGKNPVWSSTLKFKINSEDTLKVELYHKNRFSKPKFLGESRISLQIMSFFPEMFGRTEILSAARIVGFLDIYIKHETGQSAHQLNHPNQIGFLNSLLPSSVQSLDQTSEEGKNSQSRSPYLPSLSANYIQKMHNNRKEELSKEEEQEEFNVPESERCVVCLTKSKAGVFYRCGHNCCCVKCGMAFIGSRCPICRQVVFDFIKVFRV